MPFVADTAAPARTGRFVPDTQEKSPTRSGEGSSGASPNRETSSAPQPSAVNIETLLPAARASQQAENQKQMDDIKSRAATKDHLARVLADNSKDPEFAGLTALHEMSRPERSLDPMLVSTAPLKASYGQAKSLTDPLFEIPTVPKPPASAGTSERLATQTVNDLVGAANFAQSPAGAALALVGAGPAGKVLLGTVFGSQMAAESGKKAGEFSVTHRPEDAADSAVAAIFAVGGAKLAKEGLPVTAKVLEARAKTTAKGPEPKPATSSEPPVEQQPAPATAQPAPVPELHQAETDFLNSLKGESNANEPNAPSGQIPPEPVVTPEQTPEVKAETGDTRETPSPEAKEAPVTTSPEPPSGAAPAGEGAAPADVERYNEIQKQLTAIGDLNDPQFEPLWKESEAIKNKYGGAVPTEAMETAGKSAGNEPAKTEPVTETPTETKQETKPAVEPPVSKPATVQDLAHTESDLKGKIDLPKGATFVRATDQKGRISTVPVKDVMSGNVLKGAGPFKSIEAGTMGKGNVFTRAGDVEVRTPHVPSPERVERLKARPESDFQMKKPKRGEAGFINADVLGDIVDAGRAVFTKGMEFAQWSARMVREFGAKIRPYLERAWNVINGGMLPHARERGAIDVSGVWDWAKKAAKEVTDIPRFTDFKKSINGLSESGQRSFLEAHDLVDTANKAMPDKANVDAVRTWIEAKGEAARTGETQDEVLNRWQATNKNKRTQYKYDAAVLFGPEEKAFANKVEKFYADKEKLAQKWGVIDEGKDAYVNRQWKPGDANKRAFALTGRRLKSTASFSLRRSIDTAFEGEQPIFDPVTGKKLTDGMVPLTDHIGELMALYSSELNKVIATRKLIADLSEGRASDGRPLVSPKGFLRSVEDNKGVQVHLAYPEAKTKVKNATGTAESAADYKDSEHPALKKWKWVGEDENGKPILMQSDLAVHPDVAGHLNRILGSSKISNWYNSEGSALAEIPKTIVRGLDNAQGLMKEALFSFSGFHYVTIGEHVAEHRVNPLGELGKSVANIASAPIPVLNEMVKKSLGLKMVDYNDPNVTNWMRHSLMLAPDSVSAASFMEGTGGVSRLGRVPIVGKAAKFISDDLFTRYIPALKLRMADTIFERNKHIYAKELSAGKVTLDDVQYLTAHQVNAATSHLNMIDLGRDPTLQHFLRLSVLAPDFTESRARFALQAAKGATGAKVGREQITAVLLGGAVIYSTARVLNQLLDGDPHWKPRDAFSVVNGNRRYEIRSVQGDALKAVTDTRSFIQGRLAPIARGFEEAGTGVNYRGEKVSGWDALGETLTTFIPISIKQVPGLRDLTKTTRDNPVTPWEQFLGAVGVHTSRYSPISNTYGLAHDWKQAHGLPTDTGTYPVSKYQQLRYALEDNDQERAAAEYKKLKDSGESPAKIKAGFHTSIMHPFTGKNSTDEEFKRSLDAKGKATYDEAVSLRQRILQRFDKVAR